MPAVESQLEKVKQIGVDPYSRYQASMLLSLASNSAKSFVESLSLLLVWHRQEALSKERDNPEFFLSVAGLGLCRLAVLKKVCSVEDFPANDVFLPIQLLEA
jgi:hypothetical protein